MWGDEGKPHTFIGAPKPHNFDAMSAAWNDPVKFALEVAKYRAQLADTRTGHRAWEDA